MKRKNSNSHYENIDKFSKIIRRCDAFGSVYNPMNPQISIANMILRRDKADQLESEYLKEKIRRKESINERGVLIGQLVRLMRRVRNTVGGSEISKKDMKYLVADIDKFTGDKVRRTIVKKGKKVRRKKSNSHLGATSRYNTFKKIIEKLRNEPRYAPNEPILTLAALEDAASRFLNLNDIILRDDAIVSTKKTERDKLLYLEDEGLVDLSLICKKYVKGVFGAQSEEAKSVTSIKLRRFMRMK